jgi:hypothetical protein
VLRGIVGWAKPLSRQSNVTRSVQLQHQAPGDHVARAAIGLPPVPGRTELGREPPPTQTGMGGDQLADKFNFLGANLAAPVNKLALHDRQLRRSKMERKSLVDIFSLQSWALP